MIKNLSVLEQKIEDRTYTLLCNGQATWGELHDVLWKMKDYVLQQMHEAHQSQQTKEEPDLKAV